MKRRKKSGCFGKFLFVLLLATVLTAAIIYSVNPKELKDIISNYQMMIDKDDNIETIIPEELVGCFYFNQLSQEDKIIYQEILQGVQEMKTEIQVHSTEPESIGNIYQKVLYDSPDLFWCDGSATTTLFSNDSIFTPNYNCTMEEKNIRQQKIDTAITECINGVPDSESTYDKVKYIYEYLVNQTDYQLDCADSQNIYSALVNKVSVCAGYSKATQLLLQKIGIECIYVLGRTVETGQPHAWNIVNLDGEYYHVDTTWGDPIFVMQEEDVQNVSHISYDYLCSTDEEIAKTHEWDTSQGLPLCTSAQYNYYIMNGCYYETYDPDALLKAMNDTIYAGGEQTIFKFANDEVYNEAKNAVLEELASRAMQNLMSAYGLSSVSCRRMVDDSNDKIIIYWNYDS